MCWSCYSPTSSRGRVLVKQASVAMYVRRFAIISPPHNLLNTKKQRIFYQQATYEDNFSTHPQPKNSFWFVSISFLKRPILFEVLASTSLFSMRKAHAIAEP